MTQPAEALDDRRANDETDLCFWLESLRFWTTGPESDLPPRWRRHVYNAQRHIAELSLLLNTASRYSG